MNKTSESINILPLKNNKIIDLKTLTITENQSYKFDYEFDYENLTDYSAVNTFFQSMFDKEETDYLQHLLGKCLLNNDLSLHEMHIFFIGSGKNGKTTLSQLLKDTLKPKTVNISIDHFEFDENTNNFDQTMNILTNYISDKKICFVSESENYNLNMELFKVLENNNMKQTYIFESNILPQFDDPEYIKKSICIPFTKSFKNNSQKPDIELNDFFSWLCVGASNYLLNKKLTMPEKFKNTTIQMCKQQQKEIYN